MTSSPKTGPNVAVDPDGATRTIPERVARRVWVVAGGRCTFCNRYLLSEEHTGQPVAVGQLAHIVGWTTKDGSPRGSDPLPLEDRNLEDNLILMCHDQHRVIDNRSLWDTYDAETLRMFKHAHERRIKQLTGLTEEDRSTVLRVVAHVHGAAAALSTSAVARTLLADGRFPDYALAGIDEFEVDLRRIPGEDIPGQGYWTSATAHLRDSVHRLTAHVAREKIHHVSLFPLARVPLLVALGTMLDDTVPTEIYPKCRGRDERWGWTNGAPTIDFTHRAVDAPTGATNVQVLFCVSGTVDPGRLPTAPAPAARYEIRPVSAAPGPELIASRGSLDAFASAWRTLLAELEHTHPGLESIDVFAAVPLTAAVAIGRVPMRAIHPRLRVFDRDTTSGTYQFALEVGR
ncbi:SAVED domain-containing protein [Isoptericola sp. NPDC057559]|uniref:SAVED domain-containing protein n=1 Tax=Isoptericola sp. NPDC057559 TaxID=3346168 RepID=UPI00369DCF59